jgi:hypothetical protein
MNLMDSFQGITEYFAPEIIGEVNDVLGKSPGSKGKIYPGIFTKMRMNCSLLWKEASKY